MKPPGLFCFAHRGASGCEPENTRRAVRRALELGADGIEVDVHLADGRLMVIHDATLNRTTNGKGAVAKFSFARLRSLDAGLGEQIPVLEEIFDLVNRRALVNVELKGPATAEPVARLVDSYVRTKDWRFEDFLISSFDLDQLRAVKNLQPQIRTGALFDKATPKLVAIAEALGAWSLNTGRRGLTPEIVSDAHRRGLKVFVYTINRPAEIAALIALGVDGVFTDYPDRVVNFIP